MWRKLVVLSVIKVIFISVTFLLIGCACEKEQPGLDLEKGGWSILDGYPENIVIKDDELAPLIGASYDDVLFDKFNKDVTWFSDGNNNFLLCLNIIEKKFCKGYYSCELQAHGEYECFVKLITIK